MAGQVVMQQTQRQTQMWREIHEQPEALRRALAGAEGAVGRIADEVMRREIDIVLLAARGTSDHAALYAQYLLQYLTGIPVALATPSIYTLYGASLRLSRALVIGISQSGEAPDVVEVVTRAREAGAYTVGVTNIEGSPLATAVHQPLYCSAGVERSVAATKTYTTTCAVLALLAASLPGGEVVRRAIERLPEALAAALACAEDVRQIALRYTHMRDCVVLGRGFQYSTAREMALKLEETCYVVATPFSTADFRHGPAALVERGMPVIVFAPPGKTSAQSAELLRWLGERGADTLVLAQEPELLELATAAVELRLPPLAEEGRAPANGHPSVDELLAPIPYIVPGQLFAQSLALHRGLDPDAPRSLTKVTRTR